MARVEKTIGIKAPPKKVWEMLAFDRLLEWDEGTQKNARSVEYTSEVSTPKDKYRVGATAHMDTKRGGMELEITESLANKKLAYRAEEGNINAVQTYSLHAEEDGTRFTRVVDYDLPYGVFGKFLNSLFAQGMLEKEIGRSLENLKSILEK